MKKNILAFVLTAVMLIGCSVVAFAADHQLVYDIAFDSEKNVVTVALAVENPVGLEAADFNLGYNEEMYEFVDFAEPETKGEAMIIAGKASTERGLATCSVIFMEACKTSDLNSEGMLELVTFTFSPLTEDYSTEDFCFWASSYSATNGDLVESVNVVGKQEFMEERTDAVLVPSTENNNNNNNAETTKGGTANISAEADSNWVVYLIAGVVAVGAIAGIAFVVIKKGKNENDNEESAENNTENE